MSIEEFLRQAREQLAYLNPPEQVTSLLHLVYHTLDSTADREQFVIGLETMKDHEAN